MRTLVITPAGDLVSPTTIYYGSECVVLHDSIMSDDGELVRVLVVGPPTACSVYRPLHMAQ